SRTVCGGRDRRPSGPPPSPPWCRRSPRRCSDRRSPWVHTSCEAGCWSPGYAAAVRPGEDLHGPAASGDAVEPLAEETRVVLVVAAVLPRPAQPERARAEAGLADLEPVAAVQPHRGGGLPGLRA